MNDHNLLKYYIFVYTSVQRTIKVFYRHTSPITLYDIALLINSITCENLPLSIIFTVTGRSIFLDSGTGTAADVGASPLAPQVSGLPVMLSGFRLLQAISDK